MKRNTLRLARFAAVVACSLSVASRVDATECGTSANSYWSHTAAEAYVATTTDNGFGENYIYIVSGTTITAKDSAGTAIAARDFSTVTLNEPTVVPLMAGGNAVIVTGSDGYVYSLNPTTLATNWSQSLKRSTCAADTLTARAAAVLYDYANADFQTLGRDLIIVPTAYACSTTTANKVVALDASTGSVVWSHNSTGTYQYDRFAEACTLDYSRGYVYCSSYQTDPASTRNTLIALNAKTGSRVWSSALGSSEVSPMYSPIGDTLYFAARAGTLYSITPSTGSTVWSRTVTSTAYLTRNVWTEYRTYYGYLFITDTKGKLYALLDAGSTVSTLWSTNLSGAKVSSIPTIAPDSGKVYIGASDGKIYQLSLLTGVSESFATVSASAAPSYDPFINSENSTANRLYANAGGTLLRLCIPWAADSIDKAASSGLCSTDDDCQYLDGECSRGVCNTDTGVCRPHPDKEDNGCNNGIPVCARDASGNAGQGTCHSGACMAVDFTDCACDEAGPNACGGGKLCCGANIGCVNINVDTANCGACGNACGAQQTCEKGTCIRSASYANAPTATELNEAHATAGKPTVSALAFQPRSSSGTIGFAFGTYSKDVDKDGPTGLYQFDNKGVLTSSALAVDSQGNPAAYPVRGISFVGQAGSNYSAYVSYSNFADGSGFSGVASFSGEGSQLTITEQGTAVTAQQSQFENADFNTGSVGPAYDPENVTYVGNFSKNGTVHSRGAIYSRYVKSDKPAAYWRAADTKLPTAAATIGSNGTYLDSPCGQSIFFGDAGAVPVPPPPEPIDHSIRLKEFTGTCGGLRSGILELPAAVNPQADFSVEFWWKPDVVGAQWNPVIYAKNGNANETNPFGSFAVRTSDCLSGKCKVEFGTTAGTFTNNRVVVNGKWNHIVYTFERSPAAVGACGGFSSLWVNGELQRAGASNHPRHNCGNSWNGGPLRATATNSLMKNSQGWVDEIAVYNRRLNPDFELWHKVGLCGDPKRPVDLFTDVRHCGGCDSVCGGSKPFCVLNAGDGETPSAACASSPLASPDNPRNVVEVPKHYFTGAVNAGGDRMHAPIADFEYRSKGPIPMTDYARITAMGKLDLKGRKFSSSAFENGCIASSNGTASIVFLVSHGPVLDVFDPKCAEFTKSVTYELQRTYRDEAVPRNRPAPLDPLDPLDPNKDGEGNCELKGDGNYACDADKAYYPAFILDFSQDVDHHGDLILQVRMQQGLPDPPYIGAHTELVLLNLGYLQQTGPEPPPVDAKEWRAISLNDVSKDMYAWMSSVIPSSFSSQGIVSAGAFSRLVRLDLSAASEPFQTLPMAP